MDNNFTTLLLNETHNDYYVNYPPTYSMTLNKTIIYYLRFYISPIIAVFGILGNSISAAVLLRSKLKTFSSSHYLAAICLANSLYLFDYLLKWIGLHDIHLHSKPGLCQMITFIQYSSTFLSNWYVVAFCIDRYICMAWSMEATRMCTRTRARIVIISLLVVSTVVHINMSITYGVELIGRGVMKCTAIQFERHNLQLMTMIEVFVNLMLPHTAVILLVGLLLFHMCTKSRGIYGDDTSCGTLEHLTIATLAVFVLTHMPFELFYTVHVIRGIVYPYHRVTDRDPEYYIHAYLNNIFRLSLSLHLIIYLSAYPLFRNYIKQICLNTRTCLFSCKCLKSKRLKHYKANEIEVTYEDGTNEHESNV